MALASSAAVAETTIPVSPDFKNIKVLRVLDLRSNIVVEDLGIRAKNIHTKPVSQYMFALPRQADEHVASIGAFLRQEPKTGLSIEQAGFDSEKCVLAIVSVCACRISWAQEFIANREIQFYKITFDEPIQPEEEVRFGIKISYTHMLQPLPAEIPQVARQFVVYTGNVYVYSLYPSDEMKTTVQYVLSEDEIEVSLYWPMQITEPARPILYRRRTGEAQWK